jgi:hypothetical protein
VDENLNAHLFRFLGFGCATRISDFGRGGVFSIRVSNASNLDLSTTISVFLGMFVVFDAGQVRCGSFVHFPYRFC